MVDISGGAGPETGFVNEPIDVGSISPLSGDAFEPIDPNFLRASLISLAVLALVVVGGALAALALTSDRTGLIIALMCLGIGLLGVLALMRIVEVRNVAYQVRDHDLSYRRGVLVKKVSTLPFVRVQHARIRQGPMQRAFGLATLDVHSAGPDIAIRGLNKQVAENMKALVIERAGALVEGE